MKEDNIMDFFTDNRLPMKREQQKKEIRHYGTIAGVCVLAFLLLQELFSVLLLSSGLYDFYLSDTLFQQCYSLIVTLVAICAPFLLAGKHFQKKTDFDIIPAGRAKSIPQALLAIPAGAGLCLLSSYLTAYLSMIPEMFGFEFTMPDMTAPQSGYELFIYLLRLAPVAAVVEETAFRGVVMQPLRKYGNWFAILMSAVIFGLIHCNLVQAPFAILAGLVIGYFTIATECIWVGIAIHFLNNGMSAFLGQLVSAMDAEKANLISTYIILGSIIFGLACCVFFFIIRGRIGFDPETEIYGETFVLTKWEKFKAFFGNMPMILAIAAVCWYTHYYISL